ncbi:RNA polymerase sigma factor [Ktedonobacter racemifer]|uniref:RNA polymerase, sigma-24 subunit, ECF subfamily n=1 Tax=Ktedonobacter racemifer DSM 44963 TaxID=485913 RepID=D6TYA6_KTERA|nr:RNA polymerase sigma factor [Ktedonobacter racemifer]EFH83186.1 RNA polymerase, sigma-24 subunit, ECF subfamily [Ktedonobacter racemifer DSM 44963]
MATDVYALLYKERESLVRFCARMTGSPDAAEDLAQMTYLEAWRSQQQLRDQTRAHQWLFGIARNMCLRWLRSQQRDRAHILVSANPEQDEEQPELEEQLADDFNLEQDLEQKELIHLLEQALALLPTETRALLIAHYVEERPISEIAGQHSITVPAAFKRLQRSRDAFRQVLTTHLSQELETYMVTSHTFAWQELRLWCPFCGTSHWKAAAPKNALYFTCSRCNPDPNSAIFNTFPQGVKSYARSMTRLLQFINGYYEQRLAQKRAPCVGCGRLTPIVIEPNDHYLYMRCPACHVFQRETVASLSLSLPEARELWKTQQRIHLLPERMIEIDGCIAIVASFESLGTKARLDVILAADTYKILHVIKNYT